MMAEEKKSRPRWKRILLWTLGNVLGVIALLAILVLGSVPERKVQPLASMEENLAVMTVMNKLSSSLVGKDGKIAKQSTVELTPSEVNALIATAVRAYQLKHSGAKDPVLFGELKDKKIYLYCGVPLAGKIAVNGRCAVAPSIAGRKLKLDFSELRAGALPLPGSLASAIAAEVITELEKEPNYQNAIAAVISLKVNDAGNLELTFDPLMVSAFLVILMNR